MKKHNKFFELAKKQSEKSDHPKHQMGCVIVNKSKVLGFGYNTLKTDPNSPDPWKTTHAEFAAYKNSNDIEGATVYVFRQQRNGRWANAKPCPSCLEFLSKTGIKRVYYTNGDGYGFIKI